MFSVYAHLRNFFFFSSRRRHTRWNCDWSSDVCSSDLNCARDERTGRAGGYRPDSLNQALPVPERYPELLEIALGQLRQHIAVDRVLDERRLITPEAEGSQPAANVHSSALSVPASSR